MKVTQEKLKELLTSVIGQTIWNARETIGIKFEMGNKIEDGRGEYRFWISTSHWWLHQGTGQKYDDIVHSESERESVGKKLSILNGKKLIDVEFHKENNNVVLVFDDGLFLRIAPYGGEKIWDIFELFTPREIIAIRSDGTFTTEPTK